MTDREQDRAELREARDAIAAARTAAIETDQVVDAVRRTSAQINSVVAPNGYVIRFRKILRGA